MGLATSRMCTIDTFEKMKITKVTKEEKLKFVFIVEQKAMW